MRRASRNIAVPDATKPASVKSENAGTAPKTAVSRYRTAVLEKAAMFCVHSIGLPSGALRSWSVPGRNGL